jgi:hypothetical protein
MKTKRYAKDFPAVCVGGSAGCVDFILSPEEIAKAILRIAHAE